MPRLSSLSSPLLLGFDDIERILDRADQCGGEGYPPYNIERLASKTDEDEGQYLRITLAIAGFQSAQLTITLENNQLTIKGHQPENEKGDYLHQGIAARQFQRTFVLADRMEVTRAALKNGLLSISLHRPQPENRVRQIEILDLG